MPPARTDSLPWIDIQRFHRQDRLPPLSLLPAGLFDPQQIETLKRQEGIPVIIVFPVRGDGELFTLEREIQILRPLVGKIIDEIWIAFGGRPGTEVPRMAERYGVQVHFDSESRMADAGEDRSGKGFAMRGILHHLCVQKNLHHPDAIIQFIDGDIREGTFTPRWVIDPVGAILWFREIEVAKIVYQRPFGGRLNAFLAPLISIFDHPRILPLTRLIYLLSGEMAATLRFWLSAPFKQNFGIEIKLLTALALNRVQLRKGENDLDRVLQVYMGEMDHRHSPLRSTRHGTGLDGMAKEVFQTFLEDLAEEGLIRLDQGLRFSDRFRLALMESKNEENEEKKSPVYLDFPSAEKTFPPLKNLPAIQAACHWLNPDD